MYDFFFVILFNFEHWDETLRFFIFLSWYSKFNKMLEKKNHMAVLRIHCEEETSLKKISFIAWMPKWRFYASKWLSNNFLLQSYNSLQIIDNFSLVVLFVYSLKIACSKFADNCSRFKKNNNLKKCQEQFEENSLQTFRFNFAPAFLEQSLRDIFRIYWNAILKIDT